jgi:hypothetical protein
MRMGEELTEDQFEQLIQSSYPVAIGGYSGLGYEDYKLVRQKLREILVPLTAKHGDRLLVVSGATEQGIGVVYEVAKELGLPTCGIVSERAQPEDISRFCDRLFLVSDPEGTWEVKSREGDSYFVEAARHGELFYLGGGEVAVNEILEAKSKGMLVTVFSDFQPNPKEVKKRLKENPNFQPTPTRLISSF